MDATLKTGFGSIFGPLPEKSRFPWKEVRIQLSHNAADGRMARGVPWKRGRVDQYWLKSSVILIRAGTPIGIFGIPAGGKTIVDSNSRGGVDPGSPWRIEV